MKIYYLKKFAREYKKLSIAIKNETEKKEKIFRQDPFDSRLKTHRLHGRLKDFYAFRVDTKIRLIFEINTNGDVNFHSIGNHDIYY
jgi:mRNA-degrading endonuclease YafQ of YafQ-DinJ toxin-antitoxin module